MPPGQISRPISQPCWTSTAQQNSANGLVLPIIERVNLPTIFLSLSRINGRKNLQKRGQHALHRLAIASRENFVEVFQNLLHLALAGSLALYA